MRYFFSILTLILLVASPVLAQNWTLNAFLKHDSDIEGVAFSKDGRTLASMGTNRVLHYWDPHTEKSQPHAEISAIDRWSIDASVVPEEPHTLPINTFAILRQAVSFPGVENPSELLATGSSDQTIWLQGFPSLRPLFQIQEQGEVWAVALSPDGRTLASGGDFAGIHLWDLTTISPIHGTIELKSTLAASTARVEGLAFSPDGQTLAVATGKSDGEAIHLWDLRTEQLKETLIAVGVPIKKVAFSPDGQMIVGGAADYSNGHGRNVLLWRRGPLSAARIPHTVELDGPELVTALNKDFTFTVTVKNVFGHVLENVVVTLKNPGAPNDWEHNHPAGVWTNGDGKATFTLRFYDAGHHDIEVSVLDRATREAALTQPFIDRVEVPKPHSITPERATLDAIPLPPTANVASYEDTFIVKSETGLALEGFHVRIHTHGVSDTDWTDNLGKATGSLELSAGIYDVDVTVSDFRATKVWLEKTFPNRVSVYDPHICSTLVPSEKNMRLARERAAAIGHIDEIEAVTANTLPKDTTTSLQTNVRWSPYDTSSVDLGTVVLTVEFMNGTDEDHKKVSELLKQWSNAANIGFIFVKNEKKDVRSEIRIKFRGGEGDNSLIGDLSVTDFLSFADFFRVLGREAGEILAHLLDLLGIHIDTYLHFFFDRDNFFIRQKSITDLEDNQSKNEITMHLDEDYSDSTVLHEFGHALGFQHSHLVPSFPGIWNKEKTRKHYKDTHNWDESKVNRNLFGDNLFGIGNPDLPKTESFDPESIMLYEIEKGLLKNYPDGIPTTNTISDGDRRALRNVYGERAPADDYLFIHGTANYTTVGKNIVNLGFDCLYEENPVNIYVRQQDKVYKRTELDSDVCFNITEAVVYIESRGIISRNGVDHLEMKAEVEYYANSVTSVLYRIREDREEITFLLPLDGKEHSFPIPRVYGSKRWVINPIFIPFVTPPTIEVGGSYTDVTLKLKAAHLNSIHGLEVAFPHRKIVPSAATAPAIALKNEQVNPEETALLTNYPNPFNPETWIPYQLAKPSEVTLYIHGVDGKLVRKLALGHQAAGVYRSKARAAYWDGRNAQGERVASGLYFYTFITDDFSATRKMLIMK